MLSVKIKYVIILFFTTTALCNVFAQNITNNETIAEVNGEKISASLFQELWEMSPHLNTGNKNNSLSERINFLNTLIAYKLWNGNKDKYRVDTSSAYSTAIEEIEKIYVRDALYRKEILDKIIITPDELTSALKKQERTLVANYILTPEEEESKNYYRLLNSGFPFDSLMISSGRICNNGEPIKINYGDYPDPAESELFSLRPGKFTQPIKFNDGYYIFYLRNVIKKMWGSVDDQNKEKQKAEDVIKKRKEIVLHDRFMKETMNGVKADVKRDLFVKLEDGLLKSFAGKKAKEEKKSYITLSANEFTELENVFSSDELKSRFINIGNDTIKFGKCLRALFFNGLRMSASDTVTIKKTFDTYVRNMIQMEVLYKKGIEEGLLYSPEVQKYINMWSEFYSFETIRGGMLDTVDVRTEEVRNAYNNIYKNMTENIFLQFDYKCFADSNKANDGFDQIQKGKIFDNLQSSKDLKISNAFFSDNKKWIPISECGDYKDDLLKLEKGSCPKPFRYDSLFVLLKVIDKKQSKEMLGYASYDEAYPQLKKQLAWEKIQNKITKKTADFAVGAEIKVNYEEQKKLDMTRISSMTVRFIGFGGSVSGVPIYIPNNQWVDLLDSKQLLP